MTIVALLVTAGNSWANTVVYEKVEFFQTETFFIDTFEIIDAGTYTATLTDFGFPMPMVVTGMDVITMTDTLGRLLAPGSFTFNATPGTYSVGFFGAANASAPLQLGQYGIEIAQIPIPAAVWLFGSGLLGLSLVSRRDKAA